MSIRVEVDISQVLDRLERARGELGQNRQEFVRELAWRLMQRIIDRTPVDTGRARAGWNGGAGQKIDDAHTTIISVTNDVEYINYLEYGTRKMKARAMVRSSMSQARSDVGSIPLNIFK